MTYDSSPTAQMEGKTSATLDSSATSLRQSDNKKLILLMGARSSGKTSLIDFVFKKVNPANSLYTDATRKPTPYDFHAIVDFQLWDLPGGQFEIETLALPMSQIASIIYFIDAQAYSAESTADIEHKIAYSYARMRALNPRIHFDIFLHKTDSLSAEYRTELTESARERIEDEMNDLPVEHWGKPGRPPAHLPDITFHLTSIFDHSCYQSISRILMRLLPCQAALEQLLDVLSANCDMDKAFLFSMDTKIYLGTDSSPVDAKTHQFCSDFIDLCVDFGRLYEKDDGLSRQPSPMRPANPLSTSQSSARSTASSQAKKWKTSRVNLATGVSVAHWQIDERLALIALLRAHVLDRKNALIEYNVARFRTSVQDISGLEGIH